VFNGNIGLPMIIDYLVFLLKSFHEYIIGITSHFNSSNFNSGYPRINRGSPLSDSEVTRQKVDRVKYSSAVR